MHPNLLVSESIKMVRAADETHTAFMERCAAAALTEERMIDGNMGVMCPDCAPGGAAMGDEIELRETSTCCYNCERTAAQYYGW